MSHGREGHPAADHSDVGATLTPLPAAVLWDMDGTLVDTEPYWMEAERELAAAHGATWTDENALALVGNALLDSGVYIQRVMNLSMTPEAIVDYLLDGVVARVERAVPWRPGARELLEQFAAAGVPQALVTMSYRRFVEPIVRHLPAATFSAIVTGDEVTQGKPHPEPYLRAAELLHLAPSETIAIEDSGPGVASAHAAGCQVLCVPSHVAVDPTPGVVFAETLAGLTPSSLCELVGAGR